MACTFDKDGNLLRFESGNIWFNASHYHEDKGDRSRDFPMGSLQSSCGEYEHRTGKRGTLALIEAEKAAWMVSPERKAMLAIIELNVAGAMASVKEPVMVKGGPKTKAVKAKEPKPTKAIPKAKASAPKRAVATPNKTTKKKPRA